mmetsp:Transcript_1989/g.2939  ORF Transcript_1989/g.2939 Transcript_1989/m.2939 type:complete len:902 (-) Transcript_1989:66-2771(-)
MRFASAKEHITMTDDDNKTVELEMGELLPAAPPADETPKFTNKSNAGAPQSASPTSATTIVDEARECLAQSNLMFLYADLRLLSATGRINTKFETLCIDSDRVPRTTASQMAQLPGEISSRLNSSNHPDGQPYCEGVSPAQIMAILMVELDKEVRAYRKRAKAQLRKENERGIIASVVGGAAADVNEDNGTDSDSDDADDDAGVLNTVTDPKRRKDVETQMHQMVRAHNDMLYKDMVGVPEVQVSKAVFHKYPLKKNPLKGNSGMTSNFTSQFRIFSHDEGDINDDSFNSREGSKLDQSWLTSFRKSTLSSTNKAAEENVVGGGDLEGGEGDAEAKVPQQEQQQAILPLKAVIAATKLLKKKSSPKPKDDMSNTTINVKAPVEEQQHVNRRYVGMSSGFSDGPGKQLSGIVEGDDEELLAQSNSSLSPLGEEANESTEEKNEEGDDSFDIDSAGKTNAPHSGYTLGDGALDDPVRRQLKFPTANRRGSALTRQLTTRITQYREEHAVYNKGMIGFINADDYDTFNGAENVGAQLMRMSIIPPDKPSSFLGDSSSDPEGKATMSENELYDYMTKCIESREPDRLDFMSDFFRENTVSWTMVKSKTRIVWLQDWFPIKDPIYGIAVDKEKKRVLVVFRGAITRPDWGHAFDHALIHTRNPVKGDYEGRTNTVKLHRGFYRYLLRTRKDTKTCKYDEIANKVYEYGSKMIGEDFTVTVNGYSLGGSLSMLFGFYASTDERFTKNGPVKIFTYGAPYMGGHTFGDAFRHQERSRKVQCARFFNNNDVVAHLPVNIKMTKRGSPFMPVGIDVKLHPARGQISCFGNKSPAFKYNKKLPPVKSYFAALKLNCFLNMTWPWKIQPTHALPELQKRLVMAVQLAKNAEDPLLHKTLDELYDELVFKKSE